MSEFTIYHNPRCSKSRNTLALLKEHGVDPEVVLYLESPPTLNELRQLLAKLDIPASQLVRRGEDEFKSRGFGKDTSDDALLVAMAEAPKLIERPIVVKGNQAVLGRPPENVLALLN